MPYHSPHPEKTVLFPLMQFLIEFKGTSQAKGLEDEVTIPLQAFSSLPGGLQITSPQDIQLLKGDLEFLARERRGKLLKVENSEVFENFSENLGGNITIKLTYDSFVLAKYYKELMERDQLRYRGRYNIDGVLAQLGARLENNSPGQVNKFPAGTHWGNIVFEFMNETAIRVSSNLGLFEPFNLTAEEMEMASERSGQATKQWELLKNFAAHHGEIAVDSHSNAGRAESQQKHLLAEKLQKSCGLVEDPFEDTRGEGIYKIKIQFADRLANSSRIPRVPTAQNQSDMIGSEVQNMFRELPQPGIEDFPNLTEESEGS